MIAPDTTTGSTATKMIVNINFDDVPSHEISA